MKKFALVGGNKVQNIVVAEDEKSIGPLANAYLCIDITDLPNPPSFGWNYSRTSGFYIDVPENLVSSLKGDTLTLEFAEPAKATTSSKKKASSTETSEKE